MDSGRRGSGIESAAAEEALGAGEIFAAGEDCGLTTFVVIGAGKEIAVINVGIAEIPAPGFNSGVTPLAEGSNHSLSDLFNILWTHGGYSFWGLSYYLSVILCGETLNMNTFIKSQITMTIIPNKSPKHRDLLLTPLQSLCYLVELLRKPKPRQAGL
jgi:hypothetical protein